MDINSSNKTYSGLVSQISETYKSGQKKALQVVNTTLVETYWKIGQHIVEFELKGADRATYGNKLIETLAKDLFLEHGKGFSRSNLNYMRLIYTYYPIYQTVSGKLGWSHYVELLSIDNPVERLFYEKKCIQENWSIRELKRQKSASLYLRLAMSKDKEAMLKSIEQEKRAFRPEDIVRDSYVLDFLKIPEPNQYTETELEQRIIDNLQQFLLELGKGFAFVGRQYRISIGNRHFYVDLVFYHRILKCFVLIDLKKEQAGHQDIGQMNMYLGYFELEENTEGDNPPIGIVLAKDKDDLLIKYATHNISSQLFVSKYQLYLPDEGELRSVVEAQLNLI
ncbi:PDDEXK nuclease domain-containing protein [Pedobacter africanus]|uniref:Predicted nuclease of restriction endonuclease-like (RecB) superfamily, DUF1016 family n=1 Tax=Pedobacter africanus TaxID=151894 RepID=A0A1W2CU41_9SPHI|nr:PDDEXK nuclease domain-containing protein [Pedobacter africanus]SMC88757.1 Predicted nuclease of restriction endonuclease-like (RecB) superfamily, DUF1016 family [Pedobacter africanus]